MGRIMKWNLCTSDISANQLYNFTLNNYGGSGEQNGKQEKE